MLMQSHSYFRPAVISNIVHSSLRQDVDRIEPVRVVLFVASPYDRSSVVVQALLLSEVLVPKAALKPAEPTQPTESKAAPAPAPAELSLSLDDSASIPAQAEPSKTAPPAASVSVPLETRGCVCARLVRRLIVDIDHTKARSVEGAPEFLRPLDSPPVLIDWRKAEWKSQLMVPTVHDKKVVCDFSGPYWYTSAANIFAVTAGVFFIVRNQFHKATMFSFNKNTVASVLGFLFLLRLIVCAAFCELFGFVVERKHNCSAWFCSRSWCVFPLLLSHV